MQLKKGCFSQLREKVEMVALQLLFLSRAAQQLFVCIFPESFPTVDSVFPLWYG